MISLLKRCAYGLLFLMMGLQNGRWGVATFCKEEPVNILLGEDEGMPEDLRGRFV